MLRIERERVETWAGRAAVVAVLIVGYLMTGCDAPVHSSHVGDSRSPGVSETDPGYQSTLASNGEGTTAAAALAPVTPTPPAVTAPVTYADAEASFRGGRYDEAAAKFKAYVVTRPANVWGDYMLGLSEWRAGNADSAEAAFLRALSVDSTHLKSLLNLSRVYLGTDRAGEALDRLGDALEVDPQSGAAYRLIGVAHADRGETDDAIVAYQQALVLNDHDVWTLNDLGLLYIRKGRFQEALGPLALATTLDSTVATFQNNLGIALERLGYVSEAGAAYQAAVDADSTYGKAQTSLSRVTGRSDDPALAPLDLNAIAQAFAEEIQGWGEAGEQLPPPDSGSVADTSLVDLPFGPTAPVDTLPVWMGHGPAPTPIGH